MFKTRLLSGVVLVVVLAIMLGTGGDVLLASLTVVSLIGLYEWYRLLKVEKNAVSLIGFLSVIAFYVNLKYEFLPSESWVLILVVSLMLMLGVYVFTFPKYEPVQVLGGYFGIFYVGIFLSYVYQTRMLAHGEWFVWLIFIASWGCDTCAYCSGMLLGKHKMSPILSPKKTIEGAVGGGLGTVLLTGIYFFVMEKYVDIDARTFMVLAVAMVCAAFVSMIGDLAASAFKRQFNCKDYGRLIPGHGGILDRFDSVIFTAPVIFYLVRYLV